MRGFIRGSREIIPSSRAASEAAAQHVSISSGCRATRVAAILAPDSAADVASDVAPDAPDETSLDAGSDADAGRACTPLNTGSGQASGQNCSGPASCASGLNCINGSCAAAGATCAAIKTAWSAAPDGLYWLATPTVGRDDAGRAGAGPGRSVFVKMIGPRSKVLQQRDAFIEFCRSLEVSSGS